jgi:ABC-type multidrug transport system permease subunit
VLEIYKKAIRESVPYMVVLIVIGLAVYLNALIVQDTITLFVATIIGYVLLTLIIGFEVFSMILLKVNEVEIATKDKKIEALEKELNRQKARG